MNDETKADVRAFTQRVREKLVAANMPDDVVPNDLEQQKMILSTVDSMDRVEVAYQRIKQEDKKNDNVEETNRIVAAILGSPELRIVNSDPSLLPMTTLVSSTKDSFVPLELVPGEIDIGGADLTYDTIIGDDD